MLNPGLVLVTFSQVFITNGWMSDVVIVVAVTNREAKTAAHGISLFLVDGGTKGFQKGRKLEKIGLKAQVPLKSFHIHTLCLHAVAICVRVCLELIETSTN